MFAIIITICFLAWIYQVSIPVGILITLILVGWIVYNIPGLAKIDNAPQYQNSVHYSYRHRRRIRKANEELAARYAYEASRQYWTRNN